MQSESTDNSYQHSDTSTVSRSE